MKNILLIFSFCTLLVFQSCYHNNDSVLKLAVSSNAYFAIKKLSEEFEKKEKINVEIISGSSGKLAAQIIQGAPYDIFLSADKIYPDFIRSKKANVGNPKCYAIGALVLWSSDKNPEVSIEALSSERIDKIAIANPETAPYGKATIQVLKELNLFESLEEKLVYGESISQCNQFIKSGAAQIGFTARSILLSDNMRNEKNWIDIDTSLHSPIEQSFIIIEPGVLSEKFSDFILSKDGQKILTEFGYFIPQ